MLQSLQVLIRETGDSNWEHAKLWKWLSERESEGEKARSARKGSKKEFWAQRAILWIGDTGHLPVPSFLNEGDLHPGSIRGHHNPGSISQESGTTEPAPGRSEPSRLPASECVFWASLRQPAIHLALLWIHPHSHSNWEEMRSMCLGQRPPDSSQCVSVKEGWVGFSLHPLGLRKPGARPPFIGDGDPSCLDLQMAKQGIHSLLGSVLSLTCLLYLPRPAARPLAQQHAHLRSILCFRIFHDSLWPVV